MKKIKRSRDYRHKICFAVTLVSFGFGFLFPNAIPRLLESFRDLGTSFAFYFFQLIDPENNPIPDTVNTLPSWQFAPELWKPITFFPASWEEFTQFWSAYFSLLFDWINFKFYWFALSDFLFYGSRILLCLFPLALGGILLLSMDKNKTCTERGKKSKSLQRFEVFLFRRVRPVTSWIKCFRTFLKDNPVYLRSWLLLWALYFNFYSIVVSFIGYYFYLVSSWRILTIYTQLLKLQADLTPVVRFIPGIVWFLIFVKVYNLACCRVAQNALYAAERADRSIVRQNSIITTIGGEPGTGKTMLLTSMALIAQKEHFDNALQIMETRAAQFPNFPWQRFRDYLDVLIDSRMICDINQAKRYFSGRKELYDKVTKQLTIKQLRRVVRRAPLIKYYFFGYDYEVYRSTYNDGLKVIHLYDALASYAAAYLIYSMDSNFLFSNYSIRTDGQIVSCGNFPLRDDDFFDRDPAMQHKYSQYSHILDFDMLRLGKKIVEGNENANGAPVGVIVVSEIDKEFKNMNLLKETKINANETNQKNDLHDAALMMIRHGAIIDNKPFVTVLADLQRPEAWGAGGRELGNVILIKEKGPMLPALPFFSTYWFTQGVFSLIQQKWNRFHRNYCYRRSDETLPIFLIRNIMTMIQHHYDSLEGMYGIQLMLLEIQSGSLDGDPIYEKWRNPAKLAYSNRYFTDCLASVFDKTEPNRKYIDDFVTYSGALATKAECQLQNSYFQRDIHKIQENN